MIVGPPLTAQSLESFETLVVPRYLSFFSALLLEMLIPASPARLAHLGCATGYLEAPLAEKLPDSVLAGVDSSEAAVDRARARADALSNPRVEYQLAESYPTRLSESSFTHAFALHPFCAQEGRGELLRELRRVLMPGGQALLSLPLRGSFPELNDMIREHALRHDLGDLAKAVDAAAASRPTIETLSEEFEDAGLTEVDVDVQLIAVAFNNGREFLEDPITRLMVIPELRLLLPVDPATAEASLRYVHEAIAKYWSEGVFELTVNVGCASGRRFD